MKNVKKISIVLITIMLFSNAFLVWSVDGFAIDNDELSFYEVDEYIIYELGYDFFINHSKAIHQVNELYNQLPTNRLGEIIYPQYFGGMYINDEGNLVMLLVDSPDELGIVSRLVDEAISKTTEFSLNEIMSVHHQLTYFFLNQYDYPSVSNIASSWTDIVNNRVVVSLFDFTDEAILAFKEDIIQSPLIIFEEYATTNEEKLLPNLNERNSFSLPHHTNNDSPTIGLSNITITPGDTIRVGSSNGGVCSVGFRVNNNGRSGFVTAAHCGAIGSSIFNSAGNQIGTINSRFLGHIDAAFVALNSNVNVSGTLPPATHITPNASTPTVGQIVIARGSNNGSRSGTIAQINANANIGGIGQVTNTIIANFRSDGGDSGGIAISQSGGQAHNVQGIVITRIGNTQSRISRTSEITSRTGWRLQ